MAQNTWISADVWYLTGKRYVFISAGIGGVRVDMITCIRPQIPGEFLILGAVDRIVSSIAIYRTAR